MTRGSRLHGKDCATQLRDGIGMRAKVREDGAVDAPQRVISLRDCVLDAGAISGINFPLCPQALSAQLVEIGLDSTLDDRRERIRGEVGQCPDHIWQNCASRAWGFSRPLGTTIIDDRPMPRTCHPTPNCVREIPYT